MIAEKGDNKKKMSYQSGFRLAERLLSGGPSLGRNP
jgi:hypothetical protein